MYTHIYLPEMAGPAKNWTTSEPALNWTEEDGGLSEGDILFYYYLMIVFTPTLFGVITVVGTIGNLLVMYVIITQLGMWTVNNLLLLNLAAADIAFLVICVPFSAYKYYADAWKFGDSACQMSQYLIYVTVYVTVYTLVAISALRFVAIVCRFVSRRFCLCLYIYIYLYDIIRPQVVNGQWSVW